MRAAMASYVADHLVEVRGRHAGGRGGDAARGRSAPALSAQSTLPEGAVIVSATFRAQRGRSGGAGGADGRADRQARRQPADEGALGGVNLPQSGGVFQSTGRADDSHELKAWKVIDDAGMRGARRGRRADERDAFQLPDQRRWGNCRRSGRFGRGSAKKGFPTQRYHVRVGNHAGRRTGAQNNKITGRQKTRMRQ